MLETSNFVHGSDMRSLSLVMSECSLSGRGQGHTSNFYIVDLENFNWQDFNWHDAPRGPSAIAELLVLENDRALMSAQLTVPDHYRQT